MSPCKRKVTSAGTDVPNKTNNGEYAMDKRFYIEVTPGFVAMLAFKGLASYYCMGDERTYYTDNTFAIVFFYFHAACHI